MAETVRQRARKQPAEVRREEILDAAVRVFAASPYHGAGTADIARAAGVAEPTLYRHFSSKRELYLAALQRCKDFLIEGFTAIAQREPDPRRALHEMGEWYGYAMETHPDMLRMRQRAIAETDDEDVRMVMQRAYTVIPGIFKDVIERGQHEGLFTSDVPADGLAYLFTAVGSMMDSAMLMGMSGGDCAVMFGDMNLAVLRALMADAEQAPAIYEQFRNELAGKMQRMMEARA